VIRGGRLSELVLLIFAVLVLAGGSALLVLARGEEVGNVAGGAVGVYALILVAIHLALSWRMARADQELLPIVAVLAALGLIAVERLEPAFASRQLLWIGIGALLLVATALGLPRIDWLARYRYTWLVAGLVVLAVTIGFGVDPNESGTRLWLGFGGIYFQPSEIMKVVTAVFLASYLAEKRTLMTQPLMVGRIPLPPLPYLGPLLFVWALSMVLLVWQRDLGAALLFYLVFLAFLYLATGGAYLGAGLGFLAAGGLVAYRLFDHVQLRTRVWLDPWPYSSDDAYQIIQALNAYAAGGVFGTGLGKGYPEYVPAVHTDFVLAALGEEMGLLGTLAIVGLYIALVHRAFAIAVRARSDFARHLAAGLGATLGIQAVIILAGNLRLMPITGITLPFLSYGGSSIVANFLMVGLLLRISAESPNRTGDGP
jgi:cell division protein FtsW (lipid II flippase)